VTARLPGLAPFAAYPTLRLPVSGAEVAISAGLLVCALLPFADRRGIEP
jgi:hypothetical protein